MFSCKHSLAARLLAAVVCALLLFGFGLVGDVVFELARDGASGVGRYGVMSGAAHTLDAPVHPAAQAIHVDQLTGLDFVEFWWDAAQIPGCVTVDVRRDGQALTTLPCATQPWRDEQVSAGQTYTYRFYFLDAEKKAIEPLGTSGYAEPGAYDGIVYGSVTINDASAPVKQLRVSTQGVLEIESGVHVQGGSISDDAAATAEGCSATPGRVVAAGADFTGTAFTLCNAASSLTENSGSATVYLAGAATVQGNTLAAIDVNTPPSAAVLLEGNHFPTGSVQVHGGSNVRVSECDFGAAQEFGAVRFRHHSSGVVEFSRFDSPTNDAPRTAILLETDGDVHVHSNHINVNSSADGARGIGVLLQTNGSSEPLFRIDDNTLVGRGLGSAILVDGQATAGAATVVIERNVLSGFAFGVRLADGSTLGHDFRLTANLGENSIVDNDKAGVVTQLRQGNDNDRVTLGNNCIAGNGVGLQCYNPDMQIEAGGNYWGDADGPSLTTNPEGQGDTVLCPAEQADVTGWLVNHQCAAVNLDIWGIEVVQSVQTISNSVPLVAGKPTVVRVYPGVAAGVANHVGGELRVYQDGTRLGTLAAGGSVQAGTIDDWNAMRADPDASLNFSLPPAWLNGSLDLVATLVAGEATGDPGVALTETLSIEFSPRRPFRIAYIPVTVNTGSTQYPVNAGDILAIHQAIRAIFPLGDVPYAILPEETVYYHTLPVSARSGQVLGEDFLHYARTVKRYAQEGSGFEADLYVTVVALDFADALAHVMPYDISLSQCTTSGGGGGCLWIVGRNLNLRTVMDGDLQYNTPSNPAYPWPYADATTHEVGYDVQHGLVMEPERWDVMYSKAQMESLATWISPFHYERAFAQLAEDAPTAAAQANSAPPAAGGALWVTGLAGEADGLLYPVRTVEGTLPRVTPLDPAGQACVQTVDGAGAILESRCFDPAGENPMTGEAVEYTPFGVLLSPNAAIRAIRLRVGGTIVAVIDVPATPPAVQLEAAGYDETTGALAITWTIPQGKAAALRTTFLYSGDDGATWQPLGVQVHPDAINYVNDAFLWGVRGEQVPPSTTARVRVIVTDGYQTASATSDRFSMPDTGPWVGIGSPAQNTTIAALPLTLQGFAYDVKDGNRADGDCSGSIVWRSDVDGELGRGASVVVDRLSPGVHTITLRASDAGGHVSQATVRVAYQVDIPLPGDGYRLYLPSAMR